MYRKLVSLHGIVGLLAAPLLISYAATALMIVHNLRLFSDEVQEHLLPPAEGDALDEALAARGFIGRELNRETTEDGLHIVMQNPSTSYDVLASDDQVRVRESHHGIVTTLQRLHTHSGFWYEDAGANLWGLAPLIASFSCLLLAVTGLSMWWKRTRERKLGLIFLSLSGVYAVGLLVLIRLS